MRIFRTLLVGVLLLNYFLVIVATNTTTANAVKYTHAYSAEQPYAHAPDCQQRFYLQFDCFEQCNHAAEVNAFAGLPLDDSIFLQAHGLDFHQLVPVGVIDHYSFYAVYSFFPVSPPAVTSGFAAVLNPPPNFI